VETLARKIIDAIQNSLVGDLVIRSFWLISFFWWSFTDTLTPGGLDPRIGLSLLATCLLGMTAIWLLGVLANKPPKRRKRHWSDEPEPLTANGFGAWHILPADGLRPPAFMRRLVTILGANEMQPRSSTRPYFLAAYTGVLTLMCGLVFWPELSEKIHPWFASAEHRLLLAHACLVVLIAFLIRQWAVDQKRLLAEPGLANPPASASAA